MFVPSRTFLIFGGFWDQTGLSSEFHPHLWCYSTKQRVFIWCLNSSVVEFHILIIGYASDSIRRFHRLVSLKIVLSVVLRVGFNILMGLTSRSFGSQGWSITNLRVLILGRDFYQLVSDHTWKFGIHFCHPPFSPFHLLKKKSGVLHSTVPPDCLKSCVHSFFGEQDLRTNIFFFKKGRMMWSWEASNSSQQ